MSKKWKKNMLENRKLKLRKREDILGSFLHFEDVNSEKSFVAEKSLQAGRSYIVFAVSS